MPLLVHGETARADVDVFDREAVFIDEVLAPLVERFAAARRWCSSTSPRRARRNSSRARGRGSRRPSRPSTCCTIATRSLPAASGRIFTACRFSSGSGIARRCSRRRPAAIRASFSAPTARRTSARPRRAPAAAPACSPRTRRSSCTPRRSSSPAAWIGCEAFASHFGADFYGLPRHTDTITLIKEPWMPPDFYDFGERHGGALPRR